MNQRAYSPETASYIQSEINKGQSKVLIVEDHAIVALALINQVNKLGHSVMGWVTTGEAALFLTETEQPDLILMDIDLAGNINGFEVATKMRQQFDSPIIYLTFHDQAVIQNKTATTQPCYYLPKPFNKHELANTIIEALQGQESKHL